MPTGPSSSSTSFMATSGCLTAAARQKFWLAGHMARLGF